MSDNWAHQSEEDAEELNDVRVCDRVEASEQGVPDGDTGGHDDRERVVDLYDHRQSRAYNTHHTNISAPLRSSRIEPTTRIIPIYIKIMELITCAVVVYSGHRL